MSLEVCFVEGSLEHIVEQWKGEIVKAGRWYKKIGARVNLDQNDPENNDGEVRFWIGVAKNCARAFK